VPPTPPPAVAATPPEPEAAPLPADPPVAEQVPPPSHGPWLLLVDPPHERVTSKSVQAIGDELLMVPRPDYTLAEMLAELWETGVNSRA
jgi:hypothetical protein